MAKFTTTFAGLAAGALLLAGCSGSPEPEPSTPAGTPDITEEPTATATPGIAIGNQDDPLCAAAQLSRDDAEALQDTTKELQALLQDPAFLTSDDPKTLNEWGELMLEMNESSIAFYDLAVSETSGEDVDADFVTLSGFVKDYTMGLATAAAEATSPDDFVTKVSETFANPDIQQITAKAPAAAQSVATYIGERCGITG